MMRERMMASKATEAQLKFIRDLALELSLQDESEQEIIENFLDLDIEVLTFDELELSDASDLIDSMKSFVSDS